MALSKYFKYVQEIELAAHALKVGHISPLYTMDDIHKLVEFDLDKGRMPGVREVSRLLGWDKHISRKVLEEYKEEKPLLKNFHLRFNS